MPEDTPKPSKKIKVKALVNLSEDGAFIAAGSTFETTQARAAALGAQVEIIKV